MSERRKVSIWTAVFFVAITAIAGIVGEVKERNRGRAEQKRWSDEWYAAHPVVKEVTVIPGCDPHVGEGCVMMSFEQWKRWNEGKITAPAPTPSRKGKRHAIEMQTCLKHEPTCTITLPAAPKQEPVPTAIIDPNTGEWICPIGWKVHEWVHGAPCTGDGPCTLLAIVEHECVPAEASKPQPEVRP